MSGRQPLPELAVGSTAWLASCGILAICGVAFGGVMASWPTSAPFSGAAAPGEPRIAAGDGAVSRSYEAFAAPSSMVVHIGASDPARPDPTLRALPAAALGPRLVAGGRVSGRGATRAPVAPAAPETRSGAQARPAGTAVALPEAGATAQFGEGSAAEADLSLRGRSGKAGLGALYDVEMPVQAGWDLGAYGRVKAAVSPVHLSAGRASEGNGAFLGAGPLLLAERRRTGGTGLHEALGTGLGITWSYASVDADLGVTPVGFPLSSLVGGVTADPHLSGDIDVKATLDRRPVTDSLLSYAGMRDPVTRRVWGGVTRNAAHVQVGVAAGDTSFYAGAGFDVLTGRGVRTNTETDATAGMKRTLGTLWGDKVALGTDLTYATYARNLGGFTTGNGGYFSPRQFASVSIPLSVSGQVDERVDYTASLAAGMQAYRVRPAPMFPGDSASQRELEALATHDGAVAGLRTVGGYRMVQPTGGANFDLGYRLSDRIRIGTKIGVNSSGDYTEGSGIAYVRYGQTGD